VIIAQFVAAVILGYLLGSIPFGLLVARRAARVDIREHGSQKTGATNVLRTAGKKAAVLVLALDVLKGVLAVIFAQLIIGDSYLVIGGFTLGKPVAQSLAAMAAMTGHIWPVFLRFRGGRGVATFIGGLLAMCPLVAACGTVVFVLGAGLTRYVSLGSIAGAVATYAILVPLTILNDTPVVYLGYALLGTVIIAVMHRDNIARLIAGKERRLGEKAGSPDSPASPESVG
jgi:glycerol-3-phosphate acyltransferase PlsY